MAIANVTRTVTVTLELREDEAFAVATLVGFIADHTNTSVVERVFSALDTAGINAMNGDNPFRLREGSLISVKEQDDDAMDPRTYSKTLG